MPLSAASTPLSPGLRRLMWRLGRSLYMQARGEGRNDMRTNGELALQRAVLDRVSGGAEAVLLDVGANEGDWTLAALAHPAAARLRIHAFEPVPTTRARLQTRVAATAVAHAVVFVDRALSKARGTATMEIGGGGGGTSTLGQLGGGRVGTVEVRVDTLDDYLAEAGIDRVALLKSDTEGFDLEVMRGAAAALASGRIDVWQFEYNHRWLFNRNALRDVFALVEALPYRVGRVQASGVELYDAWHPELDRFFEANYVLVHERMLGHLPLTDGTIGASNVWTPRVR